ncbi:MAG: BON domain-containing protein [Elusimicrobia bacterium]|nr:BON domain-containing protein [Elusimicrobiota bacterium]
MKAAPRAVLLLLMALAASACFHRTQDEDDADPAVKARVEASLRGSKDLDIRYVTVDVERGVVTISGLVNTIEQVHEISHIIKQIRGVDMLLNNLAVQE